MNVELYVGIHHNAQQAAAVNRLFEILRTEESSHEFADEVESLLQQFPEGAKALEQERYSHMYPYPLHMACRNNAPISVIRALLKAWPRAVFSRTFNAPDAVRTRPWRQGQDGELPLQCACFCGKSLSTIQLLVDAWPDCWNLSQRSEWPLYHALRNADVSYEIIEYLVQKWPQSIDYVQAYGDDYSGYALHWECSSAVSLSIIQFLYQQAPHFIEKS